MTSETIDLAVLKRIPIFSGFTEAECRQLADLATITEFEPGNVVVQQGQTSQDLWILLEGSCEVIRHLDDKKAGADGKKPGVDGKKSIDGKQSPSKSGPLELAVLEPYSSFGEMSFFHPAEHSASVRARTAGAAVVPFAAQIRRAAGAAHLGRLQAGLQHRGRTLPTAARNERMGRGIGRPQAPRKARRRMERTPPKSLRRLAALREGGRVAL